MEDYEVLGLLALLLLTDARRDARSGDRLVLLEEQDRSSWDHTKIDEGTRVPSPVVHANRAVAVAMAEGPAAGLAILDQLREDSQGERWHLLHACRADLLRRLGRTAEAGGAYRAALALDPPPAEREFLAVRLAEIDS